MTLRSNTPSILSQPLRVFWNGWESNTYELQLRGWELSVSEDIARRRMALVMRHNEAQVRGMSESINWDYIKYSRKEPTMDPNAYPSLNCRIASDFVVRSTLPLPTEEFIPIDARPMVMERTYESGSLDSFAHFRKLEKPGNEIFLKEASMAQIMEMALSRQEPKQEQIRKQMVRDKEIEVMKNSQLRANLRLVS